MIDLEVRCNGSLTEAELVKVGKEVAKFCPLSKLFENSGTTLNVIWKKV